MNQFFKKIKLVKIKDILSIFPFLFALPIAYFYKKKHKNIWLVCEDKNEARDNGYWLFKYLNENDLNIEAVYAIQKESVDFPKVDVLGKTINYGSFQHWIFYLAAKYNISSQKEGKPNAALCYFLEIYGLLKNTRIFLQHGITISKADWLFYENTKMRLFICGAKPEYDAILRDFHYPKENVSLLGFCRFDNLYSNKIKPKQILVMPSWREWLNRNTEARKELNYDGNFLHSKYFNYWNGFLENENLSALLEKYGYELIFYPHRNMQRYLASFNPNSTHITLGDWEKYDVQQLLKESALLITDYSSVFMDFSYMDKPVLYYQFDEADFRIGQYAEGYFSYVNDGFGPVSFELDDLLKNLNELCMNQMEMDEVYKKRIQSFFTLRDANNCKRTYEAIKEIGD